MSSVRWITILVLLALVLGVNTLPGAGQASADTLTFVQGADVVSFDPHRTVELVSGNVNTKIYGRLVALDEKGGIEPELATKWSVTPDGMTWTFELRRNVVFHDGAPFNAEAVRVNFERMLDSRLPTSRLLAGITRVVPVGSHAVRIETAAPFGPLLYNLTHYSIAFISPKALAEGVDVARQPVGTGPFRFVSWTPKEAVVLEAFSRYWGTKPSLRRVVFRAVPDDATRALLLETGEADIVANLAVQDVDRLRNRQGIQVGVYPFNRVIYIMINTQRGPLQDARVRQALNYAVNKVAIARAIMRNLAEVPCSVVSKTTFGYSKAECYSHNPSKAKALLAQAGYPDGLELRFISPSGRYLMDRETAEAVQAQLADVGIRARLTLMEWATFLSDARRPAAQATYDLALWGFGPATNDSDFQLNTLFHSSAFPPGGNNIAHYRNEAVDRLINEARATVDVEKRKAIYAQTFPVIMRDAPAIFLHEVKQIYGYRTNVQGLKFYPIELVGITEVVKSR